MVSSEYWFGAEASFYNGAVLNSVRLNDADSSVLSRTPSSSGNRQVWTVSFWIKRTKLAHGQGIASTYTGSPTTANTQWSWESDDAFMFYDYHSSYQWRLKTNRLFRDVGSWYHIVLAVDTTQATSSNRIKIYVNGEQETSFSAETYPSQNLNTADWNTTQTHYIGRHSTLYLDGYMAEFNNIDGLQLDPTYFGETKNGVWIAKEYTGSYGTNGFRLQFNQTGTGTASTSTIGADSSGNNNHFTSSGISDHDCNMPDSPENNFCTFNPLGRRYGQSYTGTFSEANLKSATSGNASHIYSTMAINQIVSQGGIYFEVRLDSLDTVRTYVGVVGVMGDNKNSSSNGASYSFPIKGILRPTGGGSPNIYFNTDTDGSGSVDLSSHNSSYSAGDIVGVAILSDGKTFFHKNGTYLDDSSGNVGNPSTGAYPVGTIDLTKGDFVPYVGYNSTFTVNFGQDGTFAGQETSGGNQDANGIGDFMFAVPTNCLAICSSNMAEPTISPNSDTQADDHFGTLTYTSDGNAVNIVSGGNDNNGNAIGGEIDFSPDWVWIKRRNASNNHQLFDTNRGQKVLQSNETDDESDYSAYFEFLSSSNGFRLPATSANMNASGGTFVAWNWLANGATPTKTYKVKVVADSTDYGHGSGANKYQFFKSDGTTGFGTNGVDIDLQEGGTYVFDWSDSSAQGHPLRFSLTNNGTHGGGSEYTTGVVKDDSAYKTTITVASGVANLYYYCQLHSGMGAEVRTNTTHGSTNFDGSILSVSNPNTTAGFSIVTFTGTGSNATVGHGLSVAPTMIIFKNRDNSYSWSTYVKEIGASYRLTLEETSGRASSSTSFNSTDPTSSVFSVGTNVSTNKSGDKIIAYCFHSVDGYSKIGGSYVGNYNNDGPFVYTGFTPKFLLIKDIDQTYDWQIFDTTRSTINGGTMNYLEPNTSDAENVQTSGYKIDILSNAFKIRTNWTRLNNTNNRFIYMAFAEAPFKYANAR